MYTAISNDELPSEDECDNGDAGDFNGAFGAPYFLLSAVPLSNAVKVNVAYLVQAHDATLQTCDEICASILWLHLKLRWYPEDWCHAGGRYSGNWLLPCHAHCREYNRGPGGHHWEVRTDTNLSRRCHCHLLLLWAHFPHRLTTSLISDESEVPNGVVHCLCCEQYVMNHWGWSRNGCRALWQPLELCDTVISSPKYKSTGYAVA